MSYFSRRHSFERLYADEATKILAFLARRVLQRDVAVDLMAETFAQAFEGRMKFRGTTGNEARSWLYVIAERQLSLYLRRGQVEREAQLRLGLERPELSELDLAGIDRLADLGAARDDLRGELYRLPPDQRAAVELRVMEDRTYAEIASIAGASEEVIRARVSRGLRALNSRLSAYPSMEAFDA